MKENKTRKAATEESAEEGPNGDGPKPNLDASDLRTVWIWALVGLLIGALYWASSAPLLLSFVLFLNLWVLSLYDINSYRLPNLLTAVLFLTGAGLAYFQPRFEPLDHVIGGAVGLLFFPLLNYGYRALRGRDGIGLGDAKLLAGIGIWLSWQGLPMVLLVASVVGLIAGLIKVAVKGTPAKETPIPFGPFLCLAAWIVWLYF